MWESLALKKFKNKKVKTSFKGDIEPHEVFLDKLAQKKEEETGVSVKQFETPLLNKLIKIFWFSVLFLFFFFWAVTYYFQIVKSDEYTALAEKNKYNVRLIGSSRGVIYDQNKTQLVFNKPGFDLIFNRNFFPDNEKEQKRIIKEISWITQKPLEEIEEIINTGKEGIVVKNIEHKPLVILKSRENDLPGFRVEQTLVREYPYGEILSHILGYAGKISPEELEVFEGYSFLDYVGKAGIELSYESVLRRDPGKVQVEYDAMRNPLSEEILSLPGTGKNLILWLDIELQKKLAEELKNILETIGSKSAVGIALDPRTGGVLAMVSIPSYDNNLFNSIEQNKEQINSLLSDKRNPLFNRALSGQYVTGSTIKPFVAAAALEEKIISPEKNIYAGGKIEIPHRYDPEIVYTFRDLRVHGLTDMRKAIAASVNVYFYTIGGGYDGQVGLGPTRIKKYLELFGWGEKTEIDIPNEQKGLIPSPDWKKEIKNEGWWDGDTYNLSIGQGDIFVTPIQVAASYAAIANNGTLYKPKAVKEIIDDNGDNQEITPEILRQDFIKPENIKIIKEGMRAAVTGINSPFASALSLNGLPVKVAAKTGTAQIPKKDHYHNWIAVFGPYESPEIVLVILVEEVEGIQAVTLPVAKNVLEWYFTREIEGAE